MDEITLKKLKYLQLNSLIENWDNYLKIVKSKQYSYTYFLTDVINKEYEYKKEKARLNRIMRAKIPEHWTMNTFPFSKQPRLNKKKVMEIYDSKSYITEHQNMIFIGPSGCGKTGLATSYLLHAIDEGYNGRFISFVELIEELYQSCADNSRKKIIRRYQSYDVLLIDEIGYCEPINEQAGVFFELMKMRHQKKTTCITTQLGFDEWPGFIKNKHIIAALLDRITVNCAVFNLKNCISIRPKNIINATKDK